MLTHLKLISNQPPEEKGAFKVLPEFKTEFKTGFSLMCPCTSPSGVTHCHGVAPQHHGHVPKPVAQGVALLSAQEGGGQAVVEPGVVPCRDRR